MDGWMDEVRKCLREDYITHSGSGRGQSQIFSKASRPGYRGQEHGPINIDAGDKWKAITLAILLFSNDTKYIIDVFIRSSCRREAPLYTYRGMLADFGGALGLLLGVSALQLWDLAVAAGAGLRAWLRPQTQTQAVK